MTRSSAVAAIILAAASLAAAPRLSEQQARGKQIYLHGEPGGGKPITALMGGEGVEVPATVVPCSSCHGADARGRAEAGINPSNLRWDVLTRPYEAPGQRHHPPYTPAAIKRAVTMGIDPAGHKLQPAMPRYRMSLTQMEDLIAYLQKLPQDSDPGLSDAVVRIGIVLPEGGRASNARTLVEAYIARINRAGGIFGRTIELRFTTFPLPDQNLAAQSRKRSADDSTPPPDTTGALQRFIDSEQPFVLAASSLIGNEDGFEKVVELNQLPAIAAIVTNEPKSRYSFHLLAGIREQAVALARYAARRGAKNLSLAYPEQPPWRDIAAAVKKEAKIGEPPTRDALIILGPASFQREAIRTAALWDTPPLVLIPGAIAATIDDVPASLNHRLAIAVPLLPSDISTIGSGELHALGGDSISPAVTGTFASVKLLIEALRRAGRDLGREKVIDTLEGFYGLESGLTPKITFGPNRHTGTNTAHILLWSEKQFVPEDEAASR